MTNFQKLLLIIILLISVFFRFNKLDQVPAGLHADEASEGFNAFSLAKTGKDMYGQKLPILFRANGSYQPPIYTYLSIIPVMIFGNSVFAIRFLSALSGTFLVVLTFIFIKDFGLGKKNQNIWLGLVASLILAISPWAIHFSRLAVEANLGVTLFIFSIYIFLHSQNKKYLFLLGCILLGLASHAYYTEKLTALIILPAFLLIFRKNFLKNKKVVILGILLFMLSQLPYLYIAKSGALTSRFSQVSYVNNPAAGKNNVIQKASFITKEFTDHYLTYVSPGNLFFDSGSELGRTTPDISVFYPWFFVPFLFGIAALLKRRSELFGKLIIFLGFITPLAAALTGDVFYPLRVLSFMWVLTIIIALGFYEIFNLIKYRRLATLIFAGVLGYSAFVFFISYFVLFKVEMNQSFGYPYVRLIQELPKYKDSKILIDASGRAWGAGIRMIYLSKADPGEVQKNLSSQLKTPYYSDEVNAYETFVTENVVVKPLDWGELCQEGRLIVGDRYSLSENQVRSHRLHQEFIIYDLAYEPTLFGYATLGYDCNE